MKTKKLFLSLLWMLLYSIVGLIVFSVVFVALGNRKKKALFSELPKITEVDNFFFDASNEILELSGETGSIIVYLETSACAVCAESAIGDIIQYIKDSVCSQTGHLLVFHPTMDIDSTTVSDYHEMFGRIFRVAVTQEDSIMIKNPWMPEYLGFYGIVKDSLNRVLYAGSLFDPDFLVCCKKQSGKTENAL